MKTLYSVALMFVLIVSGCSLANNTGGSEEIRAATKQGKDTMLKTAEDATLTFKDSLEIVIQRAKEEIDEEITKKLDKDIGTLKAEICSLRTRCKNNTVFIVAILMALVTITALITKRLKNDSSAEYKQEVKRLNELRKEIDKLRKEVKVLAEECARKDKEINELDSLDAAPAEQSSDVVTPSTNKPTNENKKILYARDSQDGFLNVEDSYSSGKTIFELILEGDDEAELRLCEEADNFILKNGKKELLDTVCECQIENKGDEKVETLIPGKATRDKSGRWRVAQKIKVKFS